LKDDALMSADLSPGDATRCARAAAPVASVSRPLVPSLDLSVVYEIADLDQIDGLNAGRLSGFSYARDGHPNAVQLAAWFKNARFRVTLGISARTLIGPALERVYATPG